MSKKKILAVDDDEGILETLRMLLESKGFEVTTISHGTKALELFKTKGNRPDLILLDVMMPEIDGYKICRILKYNDEHKHIPIIMLTGMSHSKNKLLGFASEADDYVTKPFDHDHLLQKINKLLELEVKK
ncbi:MAG: hypothetical protein A2297_03550 [Elusimicrobia bacterium RIFOXYB2_FULL_48_7]|nr:MAG: hypothetical protein A2297_03550 [Elusimicrobia bacterium RIFOXYB2_FULL_48_7]